MSKPVPSTALNTAQIKKQALRAYRANESLRVIAARAGKSIPTISSWALAAGYARRKQGCRVKRWPEPRDMRIVAAVRAVVNGSPTLEEIGRSEGGITRAGVHRVYRKWKDWKPVAPFAAGDQVRFAGREYRVIRPDIFEGLVHDLENGVDVTIPWKLGEDFAVKTS